MLFSGAWGKMIHEKNLKQKILWHCPFNYKDTKAKCPHLKKLTCKGTLRHVFVCLTSRAPYPPPLTHCIRVYSIHNHTGKGGRWRVEPERRERGNTGEYKYHSRVENTNMTEWTQEIRYLQSITTDRSILLDDDIVHGILWVLSFCEVGKALYILDGFWAVVHYI